MSKVEYGVIGEHLSHSYSAELHRLFGNDRYAVCEVRPDALGAFLRREPFCGINVTIPYKSAVIPYLDEIDDTARRIGAVNTVIRKNGRLVGYNTDFFGFSALLDHAKIDLSGKDGLILGTGGTAKTVAAVVASRGGTATMVSRTPQAGQIGYSAAQKRQENVRFIINTTPVGMSPQMELCPLELTPGDAPVVDVIYHPLRSSLILQASEQGRPAVGGLYMLVAQAAMSASLFFGDDAPMRQIDAVYCAMLRQKRNIVLIGMPGSGKSSVAREYAALTGCPFVDTDRMIEEKTGLSPAQYFAAHGEAAFRREEETAVRLLADRRGMVIATGGGTVLSRRNQMLLRQNGLLVFLDRPPEQLVPSEDRPLASNAEDMRRLYEERIGLYRRLADRTVFADTPRRMALEIAGGVE